MTVEQLKSLAQGTLEFGTETIRKTGELCQQFTLAKRDGGLELIVIDGRITNDENAKSALGRMIHARVDAGEIEAVIMVSDTWIAEISPGNNAIKKRLRMTVSEAAAFGLCKKVEAVVCVLESPILQWLAQQPYDREGTKITLRGAPIIQDDTTGKWKHERARFSGFFAEARAQ